MANTSKLRSIQALRALAALGVVAFHTCGNVFAYGWAPRFFPIFASRGEMGVDIFFVISGFVMMLVSHGMSSGFASARSFIAARLARIVPLYWALTALFVALLTFIPSAFGNARLLAWHVIASFLFFPSLNWVDITAPVLNVGWTLNYEMWFYVVFAIAMCATRHRLFAVGIFLVLMSALRFLANGGVAYEFYTNPLVLEFVFGCCVGALYASGRKVPILVAVGLFIVVAAASRAFAPTVTETNRFLVYGIPAMAVLMVGLSLEDKVRWSSLLQHIGDSSYSLYLTHVFSVPIVVKLLQMVDRAHRLPSDLVCLAAICASIIVGLASYRWLERPLNRSVKGVLVFAGNMWVTGRDIIGGALDDKA